MSKNKKNQQGMDRRTLFRGTLKYGFGSAIALEQLGGVPLLGSWVSDYLINPALPHLDAFQNIQNVLSGGAAALRVHQAMAAGEEDWTLVQVKVVNHIYAPLVFALGKISGTAVTIDPSAKLATDRSGDAATTLGTLGVNTLSDIPRYQQLRFNKWFANMLHNGTADGAVPGAANMRGLDATDIQPFSEESVALQAFTGLGQIISNNHSLKALKLRTALPDITLFAAENELITSPLGITCLMMGDEYDKAEGAIGTNVVLGPSETAEVAVVGSRTVRDYVGQIQQYVGKSYADRASIEQNVVYRLDQLVQREPHLRREMINSISKFQNGLGTFRAAADLETFATPYDAAEGNRQSTRSAAQGTGATSEFIAQCKYVVKALDMQGQPLRNFSLMLNMVDLDSALLDQAVVNVGGNAEIRAFTYIEGMRQLAMGLNVLGKAIAEGKKMIVVVHSEGGRGPQGADAITSFALVMGPKGAGNLDDHLYTNMAQIDSATSSYVIDPAAAGSAMAWDVEGLKTKDGANDSDSVPNTGDVQMGVIEFLEEKTGKSVRKTLASDEGRFVKLKRKA